VQRRAVEEDGVRERPAYVDSQQHALKLYAVAPGQRVLSLSIL
jgi:hypothetical protein